MSEDKVTPTNDERTRNALIDLFCEEDEDEEKIEGYENPQTEEQKLINKLKQRLEVQKKKATSWKVLWEIQCEENQKIKEIQFYFKNNLQEYIRKLNNAENAINALLVQSDEIVKRFE